MTLAVEFSGEKHSISDSEVFVIGREADLSIDDNPFLHRRFLQISKIRDMWWIANIGSQLAATLVDEHGLFQAWLAPGAQIPLVFGSSSVLFTAGPTTYELELRIDNAPFLRTVPGMPTEGSTTYGRTTLTPEQQVLLVALAEPLLLKRVRGVATSRTSAEAAARLGWTVTKFNRKLDAVCMKLERMGVRGLHGGPDRLAVDRKARLVEYALAARLVQLEHLHLLPPLRARGTSPH